MSALRRVPLPLLGCLVALALLAAPGATARTGAAAASPALAEVVVTLPQPPLATAILRDRTLAAATRRHGRLDLRTPASVSYLRTLASAQRLLAARIATTVPRSEIRWRYSVVADGLAVAVPRSELARLRDLPGVTVWPSVTYHALLDRTPQLIGAPTVWGPTLATAGQGIKIGIIDDGIDQTHVFFSPAGFSYPPGFPKGQTAYTTPKVIVARTFAPAKPAWKYANTPFDPDNSEHATNVAGIAAGDHDTLAAVGGGRYRVSGIAPAAYLGNYKVLTTPTQEFGLDGNSPEIVAGIEAAVKDGMNVINLSLGEPEIEPSRDIVVAAVDAAADAGVVPVIAAGNDYDEAGRGSVGSPGSAPEAITVAASTEGDNGPADDIADFSSSGPTPLSLQLKPDVTAPGVDILSSLPHNQWSNHDWSGTSMATPHVAGAAAVLMQRHPTWTVEQIKSALESTGDPVHPSGTTGQVTPLREGGGRIDMPRADDPLVFTSPTSLSWGLVRRGTTQARTLVLADAGGGTVPWDVSVQAQAMPTGVTLAPGETDVAAGGTLTLTLSVSAAAAEGDGTGFVVLTRGTDVRHVPFWFHVEVPKLPQEQAQTLPGPGLYTADTAGGPSLVSTYRYPEGGISAPVPTNLSGPERVFRLRLKRPVANIGAVVVSHATGVRVSPRLVFGDDENRLAGYGGVPVDINPYGVGYGRAEPVVAAELPAPGVYEFVFDTPAGGKPGAFAFRVWVNDTTPPRARLLSPRVAPGGMLRIALSDSGSGVDPRSLDLRVDGAERSFTYRDRVLRVPTAGLRAGVHRVQLVASDYEEAKNDENAGPVLPNTTTFAAAFAIR